MIYFISGLGADERVFQFLELPNHPFKHIHWLSPEKRESITHYSSRLIQQIDTTQEVILIGVSFGGMIAQEIAKQISCQHVIIISSVKSPHEFSWQLKIIGKLKLHRLAPTPLLKWGNLLTANYYFSVTDKQETALLKQIVLDTATTFMVWAINAIMCWKNPDPLSNLVHIHGTSDRIFPINAIKNVIPVEGGGHFMIVNKAEEVSKLILDVINKL